MIFLSIIIPAYNSQDTIISLLDSIKNSHKVDFGEIEIIVVDDCSKDETVRKIASLMGPAARVSQRLDTSRFGTPRSRHPLLSNIKIIKLKMNQGPAHARNIGVKYAKGKIVLFLDADVLVYKNTLFEIIRCFKNDPDLYALTGVWDKKQKGRSFFPKFKALRDWSYWLNERDPKNYYYLFSTRIAAIDRKLFLRLGGFDETYKAALVEDIELTYRIARRYAVVFNPKVIVHHEFEDFATVARKYFWRSFYWSKIYRERKKFDPVATTGKEAITTLSAGLLVFLVFLYLGVSIWGLVFSMKGINIYLPYILYTVYFILVLHLFGVRKFLWFVAREEGIVFAVKSFFVGIILYLAILGGAGASLVNLKSQVSKVKT